MDEMDSECAPILELDSMSENIHTEISMHSFGIESDVGLGAEDKVEHLKDSIIASEDEENKEHEIGEAFNEENTKEEMENEEDTESETKDEETLEVHSRKKVNKLRKNPKKLQKKKKIVLRKKAKGALISMPKLDKDSVIGNVDTEMVPPDLVKMNGEESSISASMSDKNGATDVVGKEIATTDKNDTADKLDVRLLTSKPAKMNDEESDVDDRDEHRKESVMVSVDEEKKECEISEASNQERTQKEVTNKENSRNEAKDEEKLEADFENKECEKSEASDQECTQKEVKNEENTTNEAKTEQGLEADFKKKVGRLRKRGKKKTAALRGTNEEASKYTDNPESSNKKSKMMAKGTGMIFMCSSKTKKDCYRYKVLGFPASKRDTVLKICEGMKLFLFDIDSKLMYGIYKAAGPGGYNIEPKAFKSAFPSQVRFTVQEDCAPLEEKKFKKIIEGNYYSKNKFRSELTSKQVKDLCKLFRVSIKRSEPKLLHWTPRAEASTHVDHESKRPRRRRKAETGTFMDPKPKRLRRQSPRAETQTFLYRDSARRHHWVEERPHHWEEERRPACPRVYLYPEEPVIYRREVYAPPEAPPPPRQPLPLPSAAVLPPSLDTDIYRRDQRWYRDPQLLDGELRPQYEFAPHETYLTSREHSSYRDPVYSSSRAAEYHHPRRPSDEYHLSPGLRPEYRPPRPSYRYYS